MSDPTAPIPEPPEAPSEPEHPGMTLDEWLKLQNLSYSAFARMVPCSVAYPRMLATGYARPSYEMALQIERLTDGMVSHTIWYPHTKASSAPQQIVDLDDI